MSRDEQLPAGDTWSLFKEAEVGGGRRGCG